MTTPFIYRCVRCGALNRIAHEGRGNPICGRCKAELDRSGAPQAASSAELERAIADSPVPIVVDFWAAWCGPCRMAAPIFDELGRRKAGRLLVLKVDVDAENAAARKYAISGIPTFVLFVDGREAARRSGVASRADLEAWIDAHRSTPRARAG